MTSNHHAPYVLGNTRTTMATTKRSEVVRRSKPQKGCPSSDCSLQLDYMKLESLVIANQHVAVNTFPGPCTHRPVTPWELEAPEVSDPNRKEGAAEGDISDWGEVVTR